MGTPNSNDQSRAHHADVKPRRVWLRVAGVTVLLGLLGLVALRVLLVNLNSFAPQTESWLSEQFDQPILIGNIESNWQGWMLMIRFTDIRVLDKITNQPMLELHKARLALDLWDTVTSGHPSPGRLTINGARLAVTRRADGSFTAKSLDQNTATTFNDSEPTSDNEQLLHKMLSQGQLDLEDATLIWDDQRSPRGPVQLTNVGLQLKLSNASYHLRGTAKLPAKFGEQLSFELQVDGNPFGRHWSGTARFEVPKLNIASLPSRDNPNRKLSGSTDINLTTSWQAGSMIRADGEFDFHEVRLIKGSNVTQIDEGHLAFEARRSTGGWQLNLGLRGLRTPNGVWPTTSANILIETSARGEQSISAALEYLRIEDIAPLARAYAPTGFTRQFEGLEPTGEANSIEMSVVMSPQRVVAFDLKAAIKTLSVSSHAQLPSFSGLSGTLDLTLDHGRLQIDSDNVSVAIPGVFDAPVRISSTGSINWVRHGTGWWFDSEALSFRHGAFDATVSGTAHWPFQNQRPIVDMSLHLVRADLGRLQEYLPRGLMRPRLANWLLLSVTHGELTDAELHYKGYGGDFPFNGAEAGFRATGNLRGVGVAYSKRWPKLENLDASFNVVGTKLLVEATAATVKTAHMLTGTANIPDLSLATPTLNVETTYSASFTAGLEYLRHGSLKNKFGTLAAGIEGKGPIEIDLKLAIPIPTGERTVAGTVRLTDNEVKFTRFESQFEHATGQLEFTTTGITSSGIDGSYLGAPIRISAIRHPDDSSATRVKFAGDANKRFLIRQLHALNLFADPGDPPKIMSRIHGVTPWMAQLDLPPNWGQPGSQAKLDVKTDLRGLAFDLPAPFNKTKAAAQRLSISTTLSDARRRVVKIRYGKDIGGTFELAAGTQGFELERGAVVFGDSSPVLPKKRGLHVGGHLDRFSIDDWSEVTRPIENTHSGPKKLDDYPLLRVLEEIEVRANTIEFLGQQFDGTHMTVQRDGERGWQAHIKGESIAGRVFFPTPTLKPAPIEVELDSLTVTTEEHTEAAPRDPRTLPAIKFSCRQLTYNDNVIGTVKLAAEPVPDGLNISAFVVLGDGYEATSEGGWHFANGQHESQLITQINADTLDALLSAVGYKGNSHGGATQLDANLKWSDSPFGFTLGAAEGTLELRANSGRLLDVNPGAAGRLFGSLLFTALPRRFTLDFNDVFGKGIEFDSIQGSFALSRGHAYTNSLLIDSKTARINVAGRTGLVAEDYDQIITVTPKLSSSLPLAPLWLLEKVFQKNIFDKAFAYRYTVTGNWEEPLIERVVVETTTPREN